MQTSDGQTFPVCVWTSTLKRTIATASHLPFPKLRWKALDEIQAGVFDGMTYQDIAEKWPEEFEERKQHKLTYRWECCSGASDSVWCGWIQWRCSGAIVHVKQSGAGASSEARGTNSCTSVEV